MNGENPKIRANGSENAQAKPAKPNKRSEGPSTRFRPKRSAATPRKGVRITPGRVKEIITRLIIPGGTPRTRPIRGKAGVILATPITAMRVVPKIMRRLALIGGLLISTSCTGSSEGFIMRFQTRPLIKTFVDYQFR
jgi:hypothetical protein